MNDCSDTVLHLSCQVNSKEFLEYFFTMFHNSYKVLDMDTKKIRLRRWINVQNDKGLTALHFACYYGNLEIIEMLDG